MPWIRNLGGGWYPPFKSRLFRRSNVIWTDAEKRRRQAIARGRIRAYTKLRNFRYQRRVKAARMQLRYRIQQLPRHLIEKIYRM